MSFFARNIDRRGRILRAIASPILIASAIWCVRATSVGAAVLLFFGILTAFEAFRGWCVLRACGVKTRW